MPESTKPAEKYENLSLEYAPTGRNGTATVTAKVNGEVLACESFNLTKGKDRKSFAQTVADGRLGIDPAAVEAELLKAAADLAIRPQGGDPPDFGSLPELDVSRIVRPERFITPEVSGLAVPTTTTLGDRVSGRWVLYLRWADGKRERRALGSAIDLPGGGRLWVHPEPCEPMASMRSGWSQPARKRWLDGAPAPNPADVFAGICRRIAYFLDVPRPEAQGVTATLALWAVLSYCYQAWPAIPYLYVGGPLGSGKSRALDVLLRVVFRPLASSSVTGPTLFRTLHTSGGIFLLDEAERLRDTRDPGVTEIVAMLLAGYRRGATATRLEPLGESGFRTVSFEVYGPKAMACIAGLPPALASRAIPIIMFRAAPGSEKPKRRIDADPAGWQSLRDDLHALALEHGPDFLAMGDRGDVCPPGIDGRHYELWQPILALAAWIDEAGAHGLLPLLQEHALAVIDAGRDDTTPDHDETLLRILTERRLNLEMPQPKEILEAARELDQVSFRQWSPKGVANVFRRYGVATAMLHGRKVYRTDIGDLLRIQATYGLSLGSEESQVHPG